MSRLRKVRRVAAIVTGIIMMIASIIVIINYGMRWINPHIVFTESPEFIQDAAGFLDDNSNDWLENQIRTRSKETNVAVVLDCQQVKFEVPKGYVDTVVSRVVKDVYNSQKYLVATYFADAKELVIFTNVDQNGISSKTITEVNNVEDLSKEVSYLTLKLTDKMKPVKMDLTKEQKQEQVFVIVLSVIVFVLGLNIATLNLAKKKKIREVIETITEEPVGEEKDQNQEE